MKSAEVEVEEEVEEVYVANSYWDILKGALAHLEHFREKKYKSDSFTNVLKLI